MLNEGSRVRLTVIEGFLEKKPQRPVTLPTNRIKKALNAVCTWQPKEPEIMNLIFTLQDFSRKPDGTFYPIIVWMSSIGKDGKTTEKSRVAARTLDGEYKRLEGPISRIEIDRETASVSFISRGEIVDEILIIGKDGSVDHKKRPSEKARARFQIKNLSS